MRITYSISREYRDKVFLETGEMVPRIIEVSANPKSFTRNTRELLVRRGWNQDPLDLQYIILEKVVEDPEELVHRLDAAVKKVQQSIRKGKG